jgi:hypothetical protein
MLNGIEWSAGSESVFFLILGILHQDPNESNVAIDAVRTNVLEIDDEQIEPQKKSIFKQKPNQSSKSTKTIVQNNTQSVNEASTIKSTEIIQKKTKSSAREYTPEYRSGAYGLLVALLQNVRNNGFEICF